MVDAPDDDAAGQAAAPVTAKGSPHRPFPSMKVVWQQVQEGSKWQADRFASYDQKAGFLIALGGVLVGLIRSDHPDILEVIGQVLAGIAVFVAVMSLWFRPGEYPGGERLLSYAALGSDESLGVLASTLVWNQKSDISSLYKKRSYLRATVFLIAAAMMVDVAGSLCRLTDRNGPTPVVVVSPVAVVPTPQINVSVTEPPAPVPTVDVRVTERIEPTPTVVVTITRQPDPRSSKADP
ncbi:hypothetical protein P3T37_004549 [Kitasatospora sp. MAA4]|uniref:hypothetical protein n=1 Tax=Kitasatospora sp. MAA4 TaxID=3035093 RepID=UPI002475745C|nr:hypothetical protein [Kitasatospora sp. MAA4]MDH6135139.1 hypothetical protein [Kitasatospora sp. MAA4]